MESYDVPNNPTPTYFPTATMQMTAPVEWMFAILWPCQPLKEMLYVPPVQQNALLTPTAQRWEMHMAVGS